MSDYKVLWSDGRGAASRGGESDGHILTHIKVDEEKDMWKLAYLLRYYQILKSASLNNLSSIREEAEEWGQDEEEIDQIFNAEYGEEDLDEINLDGIDGGDPWIISITLNGEEIYNCGWDEFEEDNDFDW